MSPKTVQGVFGSSEETKQLKKRVDALYAFLLHENLIKIYQDGSVVRGTEFPEDNDTIDELHHDLCDLEKRCYQIERDLDKKVDK